ncbi:MAG: aminopeptidase P family protein [Gemmatimonadetes bacterium]|nr:aminopeptidase P family protein [Gemmatimonadota bacterium]
MRRFLPIGPILAVLLVSIPTSGSAQETDPPYDLRRARLAAEVGNAPVVVPGEYLIRAGGRGRQDADFYYLTGVHSPYAVLVMYPRTEADGTTSVRDVLFLPEPFEFAGAQYPMDDPRFRHAAWNRTIERLSPGPEAEARTGVDETYPLVELSERLPQLTSGADVVYFASDGSTLYAPPGFGQPRTYRQQLQEGLTRVLPRTRVADVTPLVRKMRLVKDEYEIARLRRAAQISATGLTAAMEAIRPGMTELEVAGVMEAVWKGEGAPKASFSPIVASGEAAVSLYTLRSEAYNPLARVMQDGEMVFIDYGAAEVDMYASDLCRTYPVSGRFTPEQRRIYEIVLEAQEAAIATVRPDISMRDVVRAAAQVFLEHGLDDLEDLSIRPVEEAWGLMPSPTYWIHQDGGLTDYSGARGSGVRDVGHHIGLRATDSRDYSVPLEPGMVFTVEPKIYVPELGLAIMIEDMILVTEAGAENLSASAPRSVEEIERIMAR